MAPCLLSGDDAFLVVNVSKAKLRAHFLTFPFPCLESTAFYVSIANTRLFEIATKPRTSANFYFRWEYVHKQFNFSNAQYRLNYLYFIYASYFTCTVDQKKMRTWIFEAITFFHNKYYPVFIISRYRHLSPAPSYSAVTQICDEKRWFIKASKLNDVLLFYSRCSNVTKTTTNEQIMSSRLFASNFKCEKGLWTFSMCVNHHNTDMYGLKFLFLNV